MIEDQQLGLLKLKYWPFALVPGEQSKLVWADRVELLKRISRLMRALQRHKAPSLNLLWADFGAGKTHTLRFIEQEASAGRFPGLLPIYCALPKGCRYFLDIYRSVITAIGSELLAEAYQHSAKTVGAQAVQQHWPDLWAGLKVIAIGNDIQKAIAWNWIAATAGVSTQDVRKISLHGRISSTEHAVSALSGLARILSAAFEKRLLLMIDEFQRVETLRQGDRDEINAGLHSFYNAAQSGVSIILSFSFGVEENIKHFLNKELLSRVDPVRLSIPTLTSDEAEVFLRELIALASIDPTDLFVSDKVIAAVVVTVAKASQLTPRRLLKVMGHIANEGMADLEDRIIDEITPDYAKRIAHGLPGDFLDDHEE